YGPATDVYSRRFLSDAQPVTEEFLVSNPDDGDSNRAEIAPHVAAVGDGFVVAWAKGYFSGFGSTIQTFARPLYPSAQQSGPELLMGPNGEPGPRVAAREPAGFTVVWSTYRVEDYIPHGGGDLVARTVDALNRPVADQFIVSTPAVGAFP